MLEDTNISIHALREESDVPPTASVVVNSSFLSTLSVRRATIYDSQTEEEKAFLSTLSVRRATHSLSTTCCSAVFLSTLSVRRATRNIDSGLKAIVISIHALREESDPRFM